MKSILNLPIRSFLLLGALVASPFASLKATPGFEIAGKFSGTTSNPQPGLALGTLGITGNFNLFGTTNSGGSGKGTVFKMTPAGAISTVLTFTGSNGQFPVSGLVLHPDGNFYGAMSDTNGALFAITQTGTMTRLATLSGTSGPNPGARPAGTMIVANDGNLYGVTSAGGDGDLGTIFQMTTSGSYSTLNSFHGNDGAVPLYSPVQGADGNLYGTTSKGGGEDMGTIYQIGPSRTGGPSGTGGLSGSLTTLVQFRLSPQPGMSPNSGLIQARDGYFYGTCCNADMTQGAVYKMAVSGSMKTLFEFPSKMVPVGGVVQGNDGAFYGVTPLGGSSGLGAVYKITPKGKMSVLYSFKGGAADGRVPASGLTLASDGNMYGVTKSTLFRIRFGAKPLSYGVALPVSYNSATFTASVNPNGESTTVYCEYACEDATLANATSVKAAPTVSGTVAATASVAINSLNTSSTYYYRLKAVTLSGTQYGAVVKSFKTKAFAEPTTAVAITADSATLKTTINPTGQAAKVYFRYGIDPNLLGTLADDGETVIEPILTKAMGVGRGFEDVPVEKTIGKLHPQTVYYYRAETEDPVYGRQYGNLHYFTTKVVGQFNGFVANALPSGAYSGFISVNLTSAQTMTGVLSFGGARYALTGVFGANGTFTQTILRGAPLPSIVVKLSVDPANNQLTGTVVEGLITSQITAGQLIYNSKTAASPQAGRYTFLLLPDPLNTDASFPQGIGYLSVSVSKAGKVSAAGKLGDGEAISASGVLVSGSVFPFYASAYGSSASKYEGSLFGNILFYDDPDYGPILDGNLNWYKAPSPGSALYPKGFTSTTRAIGSKFIPGGRGIDPETGLEVPAPNNALTGWEGPVDTEVDFIGGNLDGFYKYVTLETNGHVIVSEPDPADHFSMRVAPNTGVVNGSVLDPFTGEKRAFSGIIFQSQGVGAGFFLESNQSNYFQIGALPVVD